MILLLMILLYSSFSWLFIALGDPDVQTSLVTEAIFINSGENPFKLIKDSMKYAYITIYFY